MLRRLNSFLRSANPINRAAPGLVRRLGPRDYAGGTSEYTPGGGGSFCPSNPAYPQLVVFGNPQITQTPVADFTAVNPDGAFSVGGFGSSAGFQSTSDVVHQEGVFLEEAQVGALNSLGMAFLSTDPGLGTFVIICSFSFRPNTGMGPGNGVILDGIGGGPILSGITSESEVIAGAGNGYTVKLDLDTAAQTCAFEDSEGNTVALGMAAPGWNASTVYVGANVAAGATLADSTAMRWNPGIMADRLPTGGAVRPCEAS